MQGFVMDFEPNTVVCREGDPSSELYFLKSGKLLVCTLSGTQVKVISRISPGEFIGELSFFDGKPRASNVVTLEKCSLIQIPKHEIAGYLPSWYTLIGASITKKIRHLDHVIFSGNLRRSLSEETKPLSMEEQRAIYDVLTKQDA
ncbi:MAG: cyclic nucleotide-binding domain-containing protein [Bdellovibrionales bacterium]|nr:cyclic nucleotide-binding domain-containing protein [Bdellovibrionales bacterium]